MADSIKSVTANPNAISNDGTQTSVVSATVVDNLLPAAGVDVTWSATNGSLSETVSKTNALGIAVTEVTAAPPASSVVVKAVTANDTLGKSITIPTFQPLIAPSVFNATVGDGYTLDHYDISAGVQAQIPIYSDVSLDQIVTFYWGEVDSFTFAVTENTHPPFTIQVDESMSPDCLLDGMYDVHYTVADQAGNLLYSSIVPIVVADGGQTSETLPAPSVPEATGYINIADAADGVDADVVYTDMKARDVITFYWMAYDNDQRKIVDASYSDQQTLEDDTTSFTFHIDSTKFYPNGSGYEGYAQAYYTVMRVDTTILALSHTTNCGVDTVAG